MNNMLRIKIALAFTITTLLLFMSLDFTIKSYESNIEHTKEIKQSEEHQNTFEQIIKERPEKQIQDTFQDVVLISNMAVIDSPPAPVDKEKDALKEKIDRMKSEHEVAGAVYEYLNDKGLSDITIAGILGNMMAEVGGQTLELPWNIYGGGGRYYGLCMWSLYYNPSVNGLDIEGQLDYLMENAPVNMEIFGGSFDDFCNMSDASEAARYFCKYYERGTGSYVRAQNAVVALDWIQSCEDENFNDKENISK